MVSEPHELYRFLAAPDVELSDLIFANDDVVWVKFKYAEEVMPCYVRQSLDRRLRHAGRASQNLLLSECFER
jgi:hypothetical protein